ncbi:glycosyltransferase family 4 protein [Georgenia muralis]|uniref:Glycosyl transferase family 1 n=1 Tax=Georgenia muralis TaxID=154117 RepID=A0A3N4Z3F9_9MICO|nr:glycosyltransferase family 1 protein [Georgenia muralis]RPF26384.1 glycosyl transferase family 1 [Georgenia muralis]
MPQLVLATTAVGAPMGAQVYQEEIAARAVSALAGVTAAADAGTADGAAPGRPPDAWRVSRLVARSMRSTLPGNRRLPMGPLSRAGVRTRRLAGAALYPRGAVVHRMTLELPPAPVDVVTLHDVVAWRFPDESAPVAAAPEEIRRAAAVICVSRFSAAEAVELLGVVDPTVVHNGVDDRYLDATPAPSEQLARLGITGPYVLHAGGASRRKNLEGLAAAWPSVRSSRPDLTLVLTGPPHPRRDDLFRDLAGVRQVGRVPDDVIAGLLAGAAAVVVPSLYEGFGLPALEAMAARVPVVAARTSSLPEVVGDGGILVEPTPAEIAEGILWAVSGDTAVDGLVARGRERAAEFTWERSAAGHAAVWAGLS